MKNGMTPAEFRALRKQGTFTQRELADRLGVHWNTVARYEIGARPISEPVARLLRLLTCKG